MDAKYLQRALMILTLGAAVLLSACASYVRSQVNTFQRWPAQSAGSYQFAAVAAEQVSLERLHYQGLVAQELAKVGLTPAAKGQTARYTVNFEAGVTPVEVKVLRPVRPIIYGGWGFHSRHAGVQIGFPFLWGEDYWGAQQTVLEFERTLKVTIHEGNAPVFEARARSMGSSAELSPVMPYLVRSVFEGFPGVDGQVQLLEYDREKGSMRQISKSDSTLPNTTTSKPDATKP